MKAASTSVVNSVKKKVGRYLKNGSRKIFKITENISKTYKTSKNYFLEVEYTTK